MQQITTQRRKNTRSIAMLMFLPVLGVFLFALNAMGEKFPSSSVGAEDASVSVQEPYTATPVPTIQPSERPTGTPDWSTTADVLQITVIAAEATDAYNVSFAWMSDGRTATSAASTSQAPATQTVAAIEIMAIDERLANERERNANQREVEFWSSVTMEIVMPCLAFLFVGGLIFAVSVRVCSLFLSFMSREPEQDQEPERLRESVPMGRVEIHRGSTINMHDIPFENERIAFVARGLINNGGGLSFSRWTPEENGFSRDEWKKFIDTLLSAGLAKFRNDRNGENGYHLTPDGWEYFKSVDLQSPPSPTDDDY